MSHTPDQSPDPAPEVSIHHMSRLGQTLMAGVGLLAASLAFAVAKPPVAHAGRVDCIADQDGKDLTDTQGELLRNLIDSNIAHSSTLNQRGPKPYRGYRIVVPWNQGNLPPSKQVSVSKSLARASKLGLTNLQVSFGVDPTNPSKPPSLTAYRRSVRRFAHYHPNVHEWDAFNEANLKKYGISPERAAKLLQSLKSEVRPGDTVYAADFNMAPPMLKYLAKYIVALNHLGEHPTKWGFHLREGGITAAQVHKKLPAGAKVSWTEAAPIGTATTTAAGVAKIIANTPAEHTCIYEAIHPYGAWDTALLDGSIPRPTYWALMPGHNTQNNINTTITVGAENEPESVTNTGQTATTDALPAITLGVKG